MFVVIQKKKAANKTKQISPVQTCNSNPLTLSAVKASIQCLLIDRQQRQQQIFFRQYAAPLPPYIRSDICSEANKNSFLFKFTREAICSLPPPSVLNSCNSCNSNNDSCSPASTTTTTSSLREIITSSFSRWTATLSSNNKRRRELNWPISFGICALYRTRTRQLQFLRRKKMEALLLREPKMRKRGNRKALVRGSVSAVLFAKIHCLLAVQRCPVMLLS